MKIIKNLKKWLTYRKLPYLCLYQMEELQREDEEEHVYNPVVIGRTDIYGCHEIVFSDGSTCLK